MNEEKSAQKEGGVDFWPYARFIVGLTSLLIGVVALYQAARIALGREVTLNEVTNFPSIFFAGMFTSLASFVIGFWFLLTLTSKLAMIFNKEPPLGLVSVPWFLWFIILGNLASSGTANNLTMDAQTLKEFVRFFGIAFYTFLLTDLLDAGFWLIARVWNSITFAE